MRPHAVPLSLLATATLAAAVPAAATDWPQFGYDGTHSGFNAAETSIDASNVASLVRLWSAPASLPADVDSAPVYASGITTPGGVRDLVFVFANGRNKNCSSTGHLIAIDASDGSTVWSKTTTGCQPATASPAIGPDREYIYSYGLDGKAHKYRIGDGTEITSGGWPETITLKTSVEKGASGLTIARTNGVDYLVVVTDGYIGDGGDYQGHLVSINLDTGAQNVFNVMCSDLSIHFVNNGTPGVDDCSGVRSGIWGRGGATFDAATDRVYIATGNGQFNANSGGFNWGDSVLALAPDGTGSGGGMPRDSYTPSNYQSLEDGDVDLGSISPAILPAPANSTVAHLGMQVGKDHAMRLIDLDDMSGQGGPAQVGGELQILNVPQGGSGMREQPAVWVDGSGATWVFVANFAGISGVKLTLNGTFQPRLVSQWTKTSSATSPAVANGIVYSAGSCSAGTCVVARDATDGSTLWSSPNIGSIHWQSPIVVDGAIYVTNNNAELYKFGLEAANDTIFENGFEP